MTARPPTDRLALLLEGPTRWSPFEHLVEVGSTNEVVAARAVAGAPSGLVVVADHQTAGRGRLNRTWVDVPGRSLLMSVLVEAPRVPTLVPLAAGLAVADAVEAAGVVASLKWPNDVLVRDAKCAGVLVEGVGARLVVGIGVNVDWRGVARAVAGAPWTSIADAVGRAVNRWEVVADLLGALDRWLVTVERAPDELLDAYRGRCATLGNEVRVDTPRGGVAGVAVGVDGDGALIVRGPRGEVTIRAGDVTHVRPAR